MNTLALTDELWAELRAALTLDVETAGIIIARPSVASSLTLLARQIVWVPDEHYRRRERAALEIDSSGYVPALKRAADDSALALFFHTHPGGSPNPSAYDDAVDAQLEEPFRLRTRQSIYGSLILAGSESAPRFSGRLIRNGSASQLERVRVVGRKLQLLTLDESTIDNALFDRQIRAFGVQGQRALSQLRVGIVGAGGTGSAVFEQIVRLGVGDVAVFDDDLVTSTNLTRIHESGQADIDAPKVNVADRSASRIGLGTRVTAIPHRITELESAKALRDCDVVFGCTDDNRGRAILSRLAYWYLIPVIDSAFVVDTADGAVRGLFGRVTPVFPGAACLFCRGRIDQTQLMSEGLHADERDRLAAEGYVPGLADPDPSVGVYTTLIASLAVSELLDWLFGFSAEPPTEILVRLHDRAISRIFAAPQTDHYCADLSVWGRGDSDPFLEQVWP
jgi:molybdopterin/thiamine biosynthesis adenylyltransferase